MKRFRIILAAAMLLAMTTFPWTAQAAEVTQDWSLEWTLPDHYVNGDVLPITDITNIKVKHGVQTGTFPDIVTIATATNYVAANVPIGTHYWVVTVITRNGKESAPSPTFSATVTDDRPAGGCSSLTGRRLR